MQSFSGDNPIKADGNLNDPDKLVSSLTYWNVLSGLPSGKAVVAWTWFNRMGNRVVQTPEAQEFIPVWKSNPYVLFHAICMDPTAYGYQSACIWT